MQLTTVWFILIAVLWTGYFVLEGFDFGVGILLPFLGRSETDRRVMINTIGPVWDGNEVWLLTAGGATFAAFPLWYASLFSGFYLALLIILVALIIRGVAFEFRSKVDTGRWRRLWDQAIFWGSAVPALLWGVAFGNIVRGVPMNAAHVYTGNFFTLLNPYALLAGLATFTLFTLHGAIYLTLKTTGDLEERSRRAAWWIAPLTVLAAAGLLVDSQLMRGRPATDITAALAAVALLAAVFLMLRRHTGWAFAGTAVTIVLAVATLFGDLWPDVLPSITNPAYSLTVHNASSSHYTLTVMTWVAAIFTPVVLVYTGWTYWVFRHRVSGTPLPSLHSGLGGSPSGSSPSGSSPSGDGSTGPARPVPSGS